MTIVVLTAGDLRLELRGRAWLTIPAAGDVLQLDGLERDVRIGQRRHRAGGDVELELRADHLTARELEAIGFRPDTTCAPEAMTGALGADEDTVGAELQRPEDRPVRTTPLRVSLERGTVAYLPITRDELRDLLKKARRAGRHTTVLVVGRHVPIDAAQRALEAEAA